MLGNLARATYVGSSDFVWPYSYNQCSADKRKSQEINACSKVNHYGLDSYRGRGAPEIDLIESMQGESGKLPNTHVQRPYQSASLQIAPGIEIDRPILGKLPHKVRALLFDHDPTLPRPSLTILLSASPKCITGTLVRRIRIRKRDGLGVEPFLLRCNARA
jgi:hypothetical protein